MNLRGRAFRAVLALTLLPASASAQVFESLGTRATGLAGAFVAVADDASAVTGTPPAWRSTPSWTSASGTPGSTPRDPGGRPGALPGRPDLVHFACGCGRVLRIQLLPFIDQ